MTRRTVKGMPGMMDPMNDQNVPMPSQSERLMMLLEQSMQKKQQEAAQAEQDIGAAKDKEMGATLGDAGAKILAALANRNRTGQAYFNRMQDLGKAPQMTDPGSFKYEGDLQGAAEKNTMSAQQKLEQLKAQMQDGLKQRMGLAGQLDAAARDDRKFEADQKYQGEMLGLKKQQIANDAKSKNAYASMVDQLNFENKRLQNQKLERDLNSPPPRELPLDDRKVVEGLAGKVASKESIASQIEAYIDEVQKAKDEGNEKKALQLGRQMIKVLNSSEGADAVGAEEVARLGGKLEFALGNLFNSNPTQFGRDIPGFIDDAKGTLNAIRSANQSNQKIIDEKMGRATGTVKMQGPDGTIYNIPANEAADAEADGLTRIK